MAKFTIKAIRQSGEVYESVMEGDSKYAIYEKLKQAGDSVVSASEFKESALHHLLSSLRSVGLSRGVKMHEKILVAKNLGAMLEAGLSVSRAIAVLERQSRNKKLKAVLTGVNADISGGKTLHEALAAYPDIFSGLFISMVKAGEESGSLAHSLATVAAQMTSSYELTRKIRGAMMYPAIIIFAMCGVAFFMMTYVVPQISATFQQMNVPLPATTQFIIATSAFMSSYWYLVLIGIVVLIGALIVIAKMEKTKKIFDFVFLHVPVISDLVKETNSARTTRTLSSLLSAGVDVIVATQITAEVIQNSYYKKVLQDVGSVVEKGEPMSTVFGAHEKLYPPFVGEMVAVGEETGQMAAMLAGVATFYETEVEQRTKDMSAIVEPLLMIIIGIVVGFFAVSIIGPIYSIGNAIN